MAKTVARTYSQKRLKNPSRFLKLAEFAKTPRFASETMLFAHSSVLGNRYFATE